MVYCWGGCPGRAPRRASKAGRRLGVVRVKTLGTDLRTGATDGSERGRGGRSLFRRPSTRRIRGPCLQLKFRALSREATRKERKLHAESAVPLESSKAPVPLPAHVSDAKGNAWSAIRAPGRRAGLNPRRVRSGTRRVGKATEPRNLSCRYGYAHSVSPRLLREQCDKRRGSSATRFVGFCTPSMG